MRRSSGDWRTVAWPPGWLRQRLVEACLAAGQSFVVDNTNRKRSRIGNRPVSRPRQEISRNALGSGSRFEPSKPGLALRLIPTRERLHTNPTRYDRSRYIGPAKAPGFQVVGYYFDSDFQA